MISNNEQALIDLLVAESPELAPEFEILANRIAATAKVA
jgi:hypothetical protein